MAWDASVEGTDFLDVHWAWGERRCLAYMETPTFGNLNLDLDSIPDVNVINTLQMGAEAPKNEGRKYTDILRADFFFK